MNSKSSSHNISISILKLFFVRTILYVIINKWLNKLHWKHLTRSFHLATSALTLLMFCKTSFILSGWMADRTKMRVTTSTLFSGTLSLRSSSVKSHWKALQRSGLYRGLCCKTKKGFDLLYYVIGKRSNMMGWKLLCKTTVSLLWKD